MNKPPQPPAQKSAQKPFLDYVKPSEDYREERYFLAQIRAGGKMGGLKIA